MRPYTTKSGVEQFKPSFEALQYAIDDGTIGFCLACGAENYGIEPDAQRAPCEACQAPKVYGAEELLLRGLYHN